MNCLSWPKLFTNSTTKIVSGNEATRNCVHLLLSSEVGELFGDPGFGIRLKKYTFDQNNYILRDILIDEIYTQLLTFCPQLILDRKNITITSSGTTITALITARNKLDFQASTFELVLFQDENEE